MENPFKTPKRSTELPDSESNSDSDDSTIPRYIFPARRNNALNLNGQSNGSAGGSPISATNDTFQNVSNENTNNIVTPVAVDEIQFIVGSIKSSQTELSGSSAQVGSTLSSSTQSDQLGTPAVGSSQSEQVDNVNLEQVEPRRSGRVRQPPDRYGDWLTNQQRAAINPDAQSLYNSFICISCFHIVVQRNMSEREHFSGYCLLCSIYS